MSSTNRSGLKAAFTNFNKTEADQEAELKLLGRQIEAEAIAVEVLPDSYLIASSELSVPQPVAPSITGLTPRPLLQREAVRQLSFRCPISIAAALKRKAAFNQLEQQEIIVEGLKRVLLELPEPPTGWES